MTDQEKELSQLERGELPVENGGAEEGGSINPSRQQVIGSWFSSSDLSSGERDLLGLPSEKEQLPAEIVSEIRPMESQEEINNPSPQEVPVQTDGQVWQGFKLAQEVLKRMRLTAFKTGEPSLPTSLLRMEAELSEQEKPEEGLSDPLEIALLALATPDITARLKDLGPNITVDQREWIVRALVSALASGDQSLRRAAQALKQVLAKTTTSEEKRDGEFKTNRDVFGRQIVFQPSENLALLHPEVLTTLSEEGPLGRLVRSLSGFKEMKRENILYQLRNSSASPLLFQLITGGAAERIQEGGPSSPLISDVYLAARSLARRLRGSVFDRHSEFLRELDILINNLEKELDLGENQVRFDGSQVNEIRYNEQQMAVLVGLAFPGAVKEVKTAEGQRRFEFSQSILDHYIPEELLVAALARLYQEGEAHCLHSSPVLPPEVKKRLIRIINEIFTLGSGAVLDPSDEALKRVVGMDELSRHLVKGYQDFFSVIGSPNKATLSLLAAHILLGKAGLPLETGEEARQSNLKELSKFLQLSSSPVDLVSLLRVISQMPSVEAEARPWSTIQKELSDSPEFTSEAFVQEIKEAYPGQAGAVKIAEWLFRAIMGLCHPNPKSLAKPIRALMLAGPPGSGKTSLAREISEHLADFAERSQGVPEQAENTVVCFSPAGAAVREGIRGPRLSVLIGKAIIDAVQEKYGVSLKQAISIINEGWVTAVVILDELANRLVQSEERGQTTASEAAANRLALAIELLEYTDPRGPKIIFELEKDSRGLPEQVCLTPKAVFIVTGAMEALQQTRLAKATKEEMVRNDQSSYLPPERKDIAEAIGPEVGGQLTTRLRLITTENPSKNDLVKAFFGKYGQLNRFLELLAYRARDRGLFIGQHSSGEGKEDNIIIDTKMVEKVIAEFLEPLNLYERAFFRVLNEILVELNRLVGPSLTALIKGGEVDGLSVVERDGQNWLKVEEEFFRTALGLSSDE